MAHAHGDQFKAITQPVKPGLQRMQVVRDAFSIARRQSFKRSSMCSAAAGSVAMSLKWR